MKVPLLDLKAQYQAMKDEITEALEGVLDEQYFILGPKVADFEEKIAAYSGSTYGIGISSGSDALMICLMAEGIGPGDEVITTSYSFFATAGVIARLGATPVFVDIESDTYTINPDLIEERITPKTRAIVPVHLYGQCADMDRILQIAKQKDLVVIEDAAQAIGAEYVSKLPASSQIHRAGSMGDYGCFSFFPTKNLGGFGDGGMVITDDPERAEKLKVLRVHGSKPKYYHDFVGGNFRLDALQAAVLSAKFPHLDAWTAKRQEHAAWYDRALQTADLVNKGLITPPRAIWKDVHPEERADSNPGSPLPATHYHIYHQYVIATPRRDELKRYLFEKGIGTEIYYPVPLHLQVCFKNLGYREGFCPKSEEAARTTLALPVYPELTVEQQEYVVHAIVEFFQ
ncbi:MAG: DegT/DnrJ/EryC1/StrS family aminotransferase [Thermodesulfobacteriota bacterium]